MVEDISGRDIFKLVYSSDTAICITTNGVVKSDGRAVMGKGIALQAKLLFPGLDLKLGNYLTKYGNRAFNLGYYILNNQRVRVFTFPTKYDWRNKSDINLISKSCIELVEMCNRYNIKQCVITPPGCGNGGLDYKLVYSVISKLLDDRFVCFVRL